MAKVAVPQAVAGCTNPAHRYLNLAPMPCPDCHGWLDSDGSVMDRATTLARYPYMAAQIGTHNQHLQPDYGGPAVGHQLDLLVRLAGALARTGLALIFAAVALAFVVYLIVKLA